MLSDERWTAASPYLDEALDLTPLERTTWLAALYGRDPAVAADVQALRSDSNRDSTCLESLPGLTTLTATVRRIGCSCCASQTTPMPPSPSV